MRIHAVLCVFLVDCLLSESSFFRINNLLYHFENVNNAEDMVVTVSPANADRTGYQTNRMRSYLKCTHIEVVNVLYVQRNSEELLAHCPTLALHTCTVFYSVEQPVHAAGWACRLRDRQQCRQQQQSSASSS